MPPICWEERYSPADGRKYESPSHQTGPLRSRPGVRLEGRNLGVDINWQPTQTAGRMPGGGIARRPLHVLILADCSGSMKGEKIQALNFAIAQMMQHLAAWEEEQERAQILVRAVAFATEPRWHISEPLDRKSVV